jgi:hypothetical protein
MKTIALFISLFFSLFAGKSEKETRYYFCTSRAIELNTIDGKSDLKYTRVSKIEAYSEEIKLFAKQWSEFVKTNCKNGKCTGDLNHYSTLEAAEKQLNAMLNSESGTAMFNFVEVGFAVKP